MLCSFALVSNCSQSLIYKLNFCKFHCEKLQLWAQHSTERRYLKMAPELIIHTHSYRGPGVFHTKYRHLKSHHHPFDMKLEPLRHSSPCLNSHSIPHSIQKTLISAFQHHTTFMTPPSTFKVTLFSVDKSGENSWKKQSILWGEDNFNHKSQTTHSTFLFAVHLQKHQKCIKPYNISGDRSSSENQVNKNGRWGPRVGIKLMSQNLLCEWWSLLIIFF